MKSYKLRPIDKNKITITLTGIKEQCASHLRSLNGPLFSRPIPIVLSLWILSLTAYYCCINDTWFSFHSGRPDTKQLIADALKFHWVPVFLSRLPYVFYALILNFIAMLTGNRILRWLKVDFDSNINKIVFSIPLGWSIYSLGIFYLGISGLLYKEVVYCFITLLGILSILEIERFLKEWKVLVPTTRFKIDKTDLIFLPLIIIFITIQLVTSFSPVWSTDALFYHMALPKMYIKHHALVHIPGFFQSTFPAHTEMLYLLGLITSGETLSKLFSFSISLLFLISVFSFGNRYFSKGVGYLAAVIMMLSVPFFSGLFSEPYIDTALGLFSFLGVYAFFIWIEEKKEGYLYLSIVNCALAAATKIQGLFFVLLFFIGFFITVKIDRHFLKKLLWCILAVGIVALPWYIRTWWLTGDPVFPFLYDYLGGRYWNEYANICLKEHHTILPEWKGARTLTDFIKTTKNMFLSTSILYGGVSPIFFIFLTPALITLRSWNKLIRHLFFITLVYFVFFALTLTQSRFFYVGFAMLSIVVAHLISTVWTKYLLTRIPVILCIVALSAASFSRTSNFFIEGPFFVGLGVLDQRQFLNEKHFYRVATWVNENLPPDSKVLSWWSEGYHLDREYALAHPAFQGILDFGRINDAPTFLKKIKELGITHLLYYDYDVFYAFGDTVRYVKEFLDRCVLELLESGEITLIKQISHCAIYSVTAPPDNFVLDGNTI